MTDIDLNSLTLAALLTTAGALGLATIVTGLVAVLGRLFTLDGHEIQAAAVLTAVFVMLLGVQSVVNDLVKVDVSFLLTLILAWYAVTRLAMSIHDDAASNPNSLRNQSNGDTP